MSAWSPSPMGMLARISLYLLSLLTCCLNYIYFHTLKCKNNYQIAMDYKKTLWYFYSL